MSPRTKRAALLLLSLSVVAIMLISSSLAGMELSPGAPFPGQAHPEITQGPAWSFESIELYSPPLALQAVFGAAVLIYLFYLVIKLIAMKRWKWRFQPGIILIGLLGAVFILFILWLARYLPESAGTAGTASSPTTSFPVAPVGPPPTGLIWLVTIVMVLALAFFTIWLMRPRSLTSDPLLQEALNAVNALKRGGELKNVVLYCYDRMSQALLEEQGIERGKSMTAREFEALLQARGLPAAPVHRLTLLFEAVRYGSLQPDREDEQTGLDSLNEIIRCMRGGSVK